MGGGGEYLGGKWVGWGVLGFIRVWAFSPSWGLPTSWFKQVGVCALPSSHQLSLAGRFSVTGRL